MRRPGREAPEVKSGGCPVSHAKEKVQEKSGAACPIDHSAFQQAGEQVQVPEGGSKDFTWTDDAIRAPRTRPQRLHAEHLAQHD